MSYCPRYCLIILLTSNCLPLFTCFENEFLYGVETEYGICMQNDFVVRFPFIITVYRFIISAEKRYLFCSFRDFDCGWMSPTKVSFKSFRVRTGGIFCVHFACTGRFSTAGAGVLWGCDGADLMVRVTHH